MSEAHSPEDTAVFVDHSGRRARLLMIVGVLSGTLLIACMAILIGGAFTGTSLTVIGWPGDGPKFSQVPAATSSRSSSPPARSPSATPVVERPVPSATARITPRTTPSARTPTPSRTPRQVPSGTATPTPSAPVDEPTTEAPPPPGKTKQPPGLDPNRTQGPKK
ncbi:hypothetical protein [Sphaerisporangium perillae]|uniref:hypothetical protein n=1 Tax=Sphaerisporangium perillae TaxID=2935860 RepID=UPI00200E4E3A|nr:hypothetical protein [Sphaerisporangium perillae]